MEECDYCVVFSKARLWSSHLWNFVEELQQGIPVPPFDLMLPIMRLQHAIHVVHGGCDLQPLTKEELSLVENIMSEKFTFSVCQGSLEAEKEG